MFITVLYKINNYIVTIAWLHAYFNNILALIWCRKG